MLLDSLRHPDESLYPLSIPSALQAVAIQREHAAHPSRSAHGTLTAAGKALSVPRGPNAPHVSRARSGPSAGAGGSGRNRADVKICPECGIETWRTDELAEAEVDKRWEAELEEREADPSKHHTKRKSIKKGVPFPTSHNRSKASHVPKGQPQMCFGRKPGCDASGGGAAATPTPTPVDEKARRTRPSLLVILCARAPHTHALASTLWPCIAQHQKCGNARFSIYLSFASCFGFGCHSLAHHCLVFSSLSPQATGKDFGAPGTVLSFFSKKAVRPSAQAGDAADSASAFGAGAGQSSAAAAPAAAAAQERPMAQEPEAKKIKATPAAAGTGKGKKASEGVAPAQARAWGPAILRRRVVLLLRFLAFLPSADQKG